MKINEGKRRKVIGVSVSAQQDTMIVALCDDGSLWLNTVPLQGDKAGWYKIKDVPQNPEQVVTDKMWSDEE